MRYIQLSYNFNYFNKQFCQTLHIYIYIYIYCFDCWTHGGCLTWKLQLSLRNFWEEQLISCDRSWLITVATRCHRNCVMSARCICVCPYDRHCGAPQYPLIFVIGRTFVTLVSCKLTFWKFCEGVNKSRCPGEWILYDGSFLTWLRRFWKIRGQNMLRENKVGYVSVI